MFSLILFYFILFYFYEKNVLTATVVGLALLMSACVNKNQLPRNPKDKEEYKDEEGNRWVYNSNGNFWMVYALMNSMNNSSGYASTPSYRYYPSNKSWTNGAGTAKASPSSNMEATAAVAYRNVGTSANSGSAYSNSSSSVKTGTTKSSSGKSFSVKPSSHSFGA